MQARPHPLRQVADHGVGVAAARDGVAAEQDLCACVYGYVPGKHHSKGVYVCVEEHKARNTQHCVCVCVCVCVRACVCVCVCVCLLCVLSAGAKGAVCEHGHVRPTSLCVRGKRRHTHTAARKLCPLPSAHLASNRYAVYHALFVLPTSLPTSRPLAALSCPHHRRTCIGSDTSRRGNTSPGQSHSIRLWGRRGQRAGRAEQGRAGQGRAHGS